MRAKELPNWMQLIGLFIGILGTLILSMPDHMYACWLSITCRRPEEENEKLMHSGVSGHEMVSTKVN